MKRSFHLLCALLCPAAAGLLVLLARMGDGWALSARDLGGLAAFVSVALIAEMMAVDFRFGTGKQQPRSSMAFLPFVGMIAVFEPHITLVAIAGVVGISQLVVRRNDLLRSAYNMAQAAITAGASSFVYHHIHHGLEANFVFSYVLAGGVFFGINILLTGVAISYLKGASIVSVLSHIAGGLRYDIAASPIAAFPVLMYERSQLVIGVVVLPLILFHHFHLSKQKLLDAQNDLIRALVKAIETRDPYTSGHSVRVSTLATLIAKDMGLAAPIVRTVETAALLHDIGKIDPAFSYVISKPYDLTLDERRLIEKHAERGASMLKGLTSVNTAVVSAVRHHHERFDGNGYPDRLGGEAIPLPARIIMLCDSVDAMLSDRPYRKALTLNQVNAELRRCAGTQFDPTIVEVMLRRDTLGKAVDLLVAEGAAAPASDEAATTASAR